MIKDDLVFSWRKSESHAGYKVVGYVIVACLFTFFFVTMNVHMKPLGTPAMNGASVLHFTDDELGRLWRLRAEEEGPFPGQLVTNEDGKSLVWRDILGMGEDQNLTGNAISLLQYQADADGYGDTLGSKGQRFFPIRESPDHKIETLRQAGNAKRIPILTPYSREAMGWMPAELPEFDVAVKADPSAASWRFVLNLREDGSVVECVALSGGDDAVVKEMTGWLSRLRFKEGQGERWLGMRVEFINR